MCIVDAGNHDVATQVDALSLRSGQRANLLRGPDGENPLALDCHCFDIGLSWTAGKDFAVYEDDIGSGLLCGRRECSEEQHKQGWHRYFLHHCREPLKQEHSMTGIRGKEKIGELFLVVGETSPL